MSTDGTTSVAEAEPVAGEPAAAEESSARATWIKVIQSAGVRMMVLPVSAILGVVNTRLIIENYGRDTFAQYGLLVALGNLLPFADLGMAAAIMNAVGESSHPSDDPKVRRVLLTSIRVLIGAAAVVLAITALITVAGWWPTLLGDGLLPGSGPFVAAACLGTIAITLPVSFGQRVLSGLGKNHVTVAILGLQTPAVLLVLLGLIRFDLGNGSWIPVIPYMVTGLISVVATLIAARLIHPAIGATLRKVPRIRTVKGGRVFDVAWPMLIQMIALPIAMQSDRIVLSHVSTPANLAEYNLAAQMYLPVWQVVSAAGVALWPIFARARAKGNRRAQSPLPISAGFCAGGILAVVVITLFAPWLADIASNGEIRISAGVLAAFSVFMVFQATKYPLGMYMTDAPGLRYQAVMIVAMLPINLGLSIVLASRYGAIGPVIGSAVGVFLFQVVANGFYVRRSLRRESAGAGALV
jgi:O-antigen/teichoic acid export membrane protein